MALTYGDVLTRVLDFGWGSSTDTARINKWINTIYRDVASRWRWPWMQSSVAVATTPGLASTTISTAVDQWGRLRPNEAGLVVPQFVDWHSFNNDFIVVAPADLGSGMPSVYSISGSKIYWNPIPDDIYAYTAECWITPTDLSASGDEPLIPAADRDVLIAGACKLAAMRDKDWAAVKVWEDQYEGMIAKMKTKANLRQTETPRRVPMPEEYGGIFG